MKQIIPTYEDVRAAAARLAHLAIRTPLLESDTLNERLGARILIKPEVLQRTGSFKFRGAYNKIAGLTEDQRQRGIVAFSSGNHAQGVATSAKMFETHAIIAMPTDTPGIKVRNVEAAGASVIRFDRFKDDRMAVVAPLIEQGRTLVPPLDDPAIIAGQGTIGLEIADQVGELGSTPDIVVAPCGGGGLISGLSLAVKEFYPTAQIWGAEPEHFDDTRRSLEAGMRVRNEPGHTSICDAILTHEPGAITFEINQRFLAGAATVTDSDAAAAMREAADHFKLVVEPGGAVALAAILCGKIDCKGKTVIVVLSGGNVDPQTYAAVMRNEI
jgi:threonine dehydratase